MVRFALQLRCTSAQATFFKYIDIVCLILTAKLDSVELCKWFTKVMETINELFFVVAISVDNHICNRYDTS